jgi:hypothetical protein
MAEAGGVASLHRNRAKKVPGTVAPQRRSS